jgi:hypothetical protein
MKSAAVLVEIIVRMALFAAILAMMALEGRETRKLARVKVRARR